MFAVEAGPRMFRAQNLQRSLPPWYEANNVSSSFNSLTTVRRFSRKMYNHRAFFFHRYSIFVPTVFLVSCWYGSSSSTRASQTFFKNMVYVATHTQLDQQFFLRDSHVQLAIKTLTNFVCFSYKHVHWRSLNTVQCVLYRNENYPNSSCTFWQTPIWNFCLCH